MQESLCYKYLFSSLYLEEQLRASSSMSFALFLVLKQQQQNLLVLFPTDKQCGN